MSTPHKTQEPGCVAAPTAPSSQVQSQKVEAPSQLDLSSSSSRHLAAPAPHTHPETRIWRKSAMRSASGTGEERERQWLKRPDAVRTLAESGAGPHSQDSQGIVLPSAYQGGPNPIQRTPLPPPWQGEEVFAWMGEKKEGREELDSPKHLPVLISSFSAVGCT